MPDRADTNVTWDESELDALLRDFFRREMPAELRQRPERDRSPAPPRPARRSERIGFPALAGLGVVALVLLMVFAALSDNPARPDRATGHSIADQPARDAESADRRRHGEEVPVVIELTEPPGQFILNDRHNGLEQPVELDRTPRDAKTRPVDPQTGLEVEFPEFEIEVYPIEEK